MQIPALLLLLLTTHLFAQTPVCVNRDASPNNKLFIDQFTNAPEGSFIGQWRKETQKSEADVCTDCIKPLHAEKIKIEPIPIEAIKSVETEEPTAELEIKRTFFGRYYYLDKDGTKVYISKEEAFQIKETQRYERMNSRLQQEIAETTRRTIAQRLKVKSKQKTEELEEKTESLAKQALEQNLEIESHKINPLCVERTLNKLRPSGTKRFCADDKGSGTVMTSHPCITEEITNYLAWSMTKAFECLNDPEEPLDANLFFKKINRESNFNFWVENNNTGRGLGQMTFVGMQEVMGNDYDLINRRHYKHAGRNMLENILKSNPACKKYHSIANPDLPSNTSMYPRPYNSNKCSQLSLDEGIQRNLLASIALYRFYRDEQNVYSSDKVLQDLKIPKTNPDFVQMKNLLALLSYSSTSPQGARRIALSLAGRIKPSVTYEQFKVMIKKHPRARYLRDIDSSFENIKNKGEVLICSGT